ncbi:MAG: DUF433 domain-containing protein [Candidatus Nanohaloarchaea archaeon]
MADEIVETEGIVGGKPRIEGTRVQVEDIVGSYRDWGWNIERIASEYDIEVQKVLEALRYYYDNMDRFPSEEAVKV